jgi:hypothetical protein
MQIWIDGDACPTQAKRKLMPMVYILAAELWVNRGYSNKLRII